MAILTVTDLQKVAPNIDQEKAQAFIDDALALAVLVAPCLAEPTPEVIPAAKAILRGAVLRWYDVGTGAVVSQASGSDSVTYDTSRSRRNQFFPNEIVQLQKLCKDSTKGAAFTIPVGRRRPVHALECSLNFGATHCSCGSDLNNLQGPIYGGGRHVPQW